jgi:TetR/AcrR family tetracycline transcriptional repressor
MGSSSEMPETGRRRGTLTRRAVVEAALASADAGGLKAITFRRLADTLGVTPMSLYRHVESKEALLDALADRIFEEFELPADDGADWREQLRELARSFRRLLIAHPAIVALHAAGSPAMSRNQARVVELVLRALSSAGFSPQETAILEIELETFVLAHVMLEARGTPAASEAERTARLREVRARLLTLPPEEFPRVVEAATQMSEPPDPDWLFEVGLDLLITGFASWPPGDSRDR